MRALAASRVIRRAVSNPRAATTAHRDVITTGARFKGYAGPPGPMATRPSVKPSVKRPAKKPGAKKAARPVRAAKAQGEDWQGATLARIRRLIRQADPDVVEEIKWRKPTNPDGVPVWSHDGIICTGETYKDHVRLTFMKGAAVRDPARLFNSGLESNVRRAIDLREGDKLDEEAFKALIRAAVAVNAA